MRSYIETKKYKSWFLASVGIFGVSLICRVYCSNHLVVKNTDLRSLYTQRVELEKQISSLKFEESQLSSLSYLEKRAEELGFVKMEESLISLNLDEPVPVASLSIQ